MIAFDQTYSDKLKANDRAAQKFVFEKLYASMFRVCQRYLAKTDEAEDCLLKGFMKCFKQINRFVYQHEHSLFYWVKKIMVNECLMELRKSTNFNMSVTLDDLELPVDANVLVDMQAEDLLQLLLQIPSGYRTVFSLYVIEGYSHAEIAEMLGISESTSKTQLLKAKNKLKTLYTQTTQYGLGRG